MQKLLSEVNTTTLSGAMDIVVVEGKDGQLKSTPFYLSVSGTKVWKSRDKRVLIKIDGQERPLKMKLNSKGQGYFPKAEQRELSDSCSQYSMSEDEDFGRIDVKKEEEKKQFCVQWVSKTNMSNQKLINDSKDTTKKQNKSVLQYVFGLFRSEKPLHPRVQPEVVHFKYSNEESTIQQQQYEGQENSLDPLIILSTCGNLINSSMKAAEIRALFWAHRVQAAAFMEDPRSFLNSSALVVLINGVLYNWEVGVSVLVAELAFGRFHKPMVDKLTESKNWFPWTRRVGMRIDFKDGGQQPESKSLKKSQSRERHYSMQSRDSKSSTSKSQSKPLKRNFIMTPNHDQLKSLELKKGLNRISYVIGDVSLQARVFCISAATQVVVSDIDGTITKEDVLGQLYPIVDKTYIHQGVVKMFCKWQQLGFFIVYLTARSIGQSGLTRQFLQDLRDEEGRHLPQGPMLTSPEGIAAAFKKEVIEKTPEVIKIDILNSIRKLFKSVNPFVAGFGNRNSDFLTYQGVGLKASQIFIVDTESQVVQMSEVDRRTSYDQITADLPSFIEK